MIEINASVSNLVLSGTDGALVVRPDRVEVYVPALDEEPPEDGSLDPFNAVNTIAFLMYALDRQDWFGEFASEVEGAYEEYAEEAQKEKIESIGLRVIDGGKDS